MLNTHGVTVDTARERETWEGEREREREVKRPLEITGTTLKMVNSLQKQKHLNTFQIIIKIA